MKHGEMIAQAKAAKSTQDPRVANDLALELALVAVDAGSEAARLELHRKDLLAGIRDGIMQSSGKAKTPAEEEAKGTAQYKEYVERINSLNETTETAKALSYYFGRLAAILTSPALQEAA